MDARLRGGHPARLRQAGGKRQRLSERRSPSSGRYGAQTALAEAEVEYKDKESPAVFVKFPLDREPPPTSACPRTTVDRHLDHHPVDAARQPRHRRASASSTYVVGRFPKRDGRRENPGRRPRTRRVVRRQDRFAARPDGRLSEIKGRDLEGLEARHPFLDRARPRSSSPISSPPRPAPARSTSPPAMARTTTWPASKTASPCSRPSMTKASSPPKSACRTGRRARLQVQRAHHRNPRGKRAFVRPRGLPAFLPALLALEDPDHLPRRRAVLHLARHPARPGARHRSTRSSGCPPGAATGSTAPSRRGPTGASRANAPGACRCRCSSMQTARPSSPPSSPCKVADLVETEGTNFWFEHSDAEIAARLGLPAGREKMPRHARCLDRFRLLARRRARRAIRNCTRPADLYLEATDQHRGWFQSSLMLSVRLPRHRALQNRA